MKKRKDNKGRVLQDGECQRKDGTYMFQYKNLSGNRKCFYAKTLDELRKKEKSVRKNEVFGIIDDNSTLNQIFDGSFQGRRNISESTKNNYLNLWNYRVRNGIGGIEARKVTRSHVIKFYNELSDNGLSYSTIKAYNIMLSLVLDEAMKNDIILKNPCKDCLKLYANNKKTREALTLDQQMAFLDFILDSKVYSKHYPLLFLMITTAVRCGEAIGLTWNDIDFKSREINIDHQLLYKKHNGRYQFYIETPKTESGKRKIPMTRELCKVMMDFREKQFSYGIRSDTIDGYSNFVFITKRGNPIMPSAINNTLLNIVNAYNKDVKEDDVFLPHISAHILRHTGCTRMAEKGIDVKVLQKIMGHSDISVTMNIYTHVTSNRLHEEIKKLEIAEIAR